MAPAKQMKVMQEFQKQSAQMDMTVRFLFLVYMGKYPQKVKFSKVITFHEVCLVSCNINIAQDDIILPVELSFFFLFIVLCGWQKKFVEGKTKNVVGTK